MKTEKVKRKLTAILSADVKGYSRLMGADEVGTIRVLQTYRGVMSDLIQKKGGRVVDSPGGITSLRNLPAWWMPWTRLWRSRES